MYFHFEYGNGGNPYIAKTDKERDRVIARHRRAGDTVKEIRPGFYFIGDRKTPDGPTSKPR